MSFITPEELDIITNYPGRIVSTVPDKELKNADFDSKRHRGVLITMSTTNNIDRGHALALIPRNHMSRRISTLLEERDRQVVVDAMHPKGCFFARTSDVARHINFEKVRGARVNISFVQKRRRK